MQDLMNTFFKKAQEYEAHRCAQQDVCGKLSLTYDAVYNLEDTGLGWNVMSTNHSSMLDDYSRLITLENKRMKHQGEFIATSRVHMTQLDELLALGAEIMADHASELEDVHVEIKNSFVKRREELASRRLQCINHYRKIVFKGGP